MADLTEEQKQRIEENRQKALRRKKELHDDRILSAAVSEIEQNQRKKKTRNQEQPIIKRPGRLIDTGGGFLLDEDDEEEVTKKPKVTASPCLFDPSNRLFCDECRQEFIDSYLHKHFDLSVCNMCRSKDRELDGDDGGSSDDESDDQGDSAAAAGSSSESGGGSRFRLLTRTQCKTGYYLKDSDLDSREPPLRFLVKGNPHNPRWGDMKLYVRCQVEARALEVWGSWEKLEEEKERREENKEKQKRKKFDKKMKELRMTVRGSLYKKPVGVHEHEYDAETYNSEDDTYSKTCYVCQHTITYEKM